MIYSPSLPFKNKPNPWKKSNIKGNGTNNELKASNAVRFADQCYTVGGSPIKWGPRSAAVPLLCSLSSTAGCCESGFRLMKALEEKTSVLLAERDT